MYHRLCITAIPMYLCRLVESRLQIPVSPARCRASAFSECEVTFSFIRASADQMIVCALAGSAIHAVIIAALTGSRYLDSLAGGIRVAVELQVWDSGGSVSHYERLLRGVGVLRRWIGIRICGGEASGAGYTELGVAENGICSIRPQLRIVVEGLCSVVNSTVCSIILKLQRSVGVLTNLIADVESQGRDEHVNTSIWKQIGCAVVEGHSLGNIIVKVICAVDLLATAPTGSLHGTL